MSTRDQVIRREAASMLISAAIFGFFGFFTSWPTSTGAGLIPAVVILMWTMRGGAVLFALSALLAWAGQSAGQMLFAITGVLTALFFVGIALWDFTSPLSSGVHPVILLLLAAWNGWESVTWLRQSARVGRADREFG